MTAVPEEGILPAWLDEIVTIEYGTDAGDDRRRSWGETFWQVGRKFDDFDTFYREVVEEWPEESLNPGHRAHSIRNFKTGEPWNCLGKAVFVGAAAEIGFGEHPEVVLEYSGREDPRSRVIRDNRSHVLLRKDGKRYGAPASFSASDPEDGLYGVSVHGLEILPPLYQLSEAYTEWHSGDGEEAVRMTEEAGKFPVTSEYVNRKVAEVKKFGY